MPEITETTRIIRKAPEGMLHPDAIGWLDPKSNVVYVDPDIWEVRDQRLVRALLDLTPEEPTLCYPE